MKTTTRLAVAFLALAGAAGGVAQAQDRRNDGERGPGMRLERADADNSGDVTFEEFQAAMKNRMGGADANGDGKMTVEEIAVEIQRQRSERMARRMIERFDVDGDGALTMAEIENRQKKQFALLDRNDDGKISDEEMPKRGERHRGRH